MQLEGTNKGKWFDVIFLEIAEGVIVADQDFTIQFINPATERLTGWKSVEFIGKDFKELLKIHSIESYSDELFQEATLAFPSNVALQIKIKRINTDNNQNEYLLFLKPSQDDKVNQNDRRGSEGKYRGLFENTLEGIFILNNEGVINDANPSACSIYGMSRDELIGLSVANIFPHRSKEANYDIWSDFLKQGYLEGFYKYVLANGEVKYIEFKSRTNFFPGLHLAVFTDVTEKTRTEKALKTSEANLQAIFINTRQQYILLDEEFKIVTFNDAAQNATMSNTDRQLKVGEYIYNYDQGGEAMLQSYRELYEKLQKGDPVFYEVNPAHFKTPDKWIECGFMPVFDSKNHLKGIVLSVNDITSRKKAEISLAESEARFRSLVQNSSDIITILDKSSLIKYTSASIEKILGYREEELAGKPILEYIHEEDRPIVKNTLHKIMGGETYIPVLEYRFLHSDGFYVFLETTCNNLLENQYIEGIVLNTRDVTERKYQEENLLLLERAIDSSNNGIIISDPNQPDNPIIYANKAFEQITGFGYFDIIGKNCRYLQKDDRDQEEIEKIRVALKSQKEVSVVLRNYKKDGSLFWNQLSLSPVFNRNGELTNYIGVINDITEKKIADDALLDITQGVSSSPDHNIYDSIITHIGLRLQMDFVFVGEFFENQIRTKSLWKDGAIVENLVYELEGTPCKDVLESGVCVSYDNVTPKFPQDHLLEEEKVSSYMGIPLKDSVGKIIGLLVVMSRKSFKSIQLAESIMNIFSVRISAELQRDYYIAALKSSEQRFRDLAKNSPDIIYIIDLEVRKVVYFNRTEILGYGSEELNDSESWQAIVHPHDVELVKEHWKIFLLSPNNLTFGVEYRIKNKSGVYEWVNNRHIVLERSEEGIPRKVLLNITVITEQKKAEEALRESEARLTALIENTNDIIWSVDKELIFTAMNSSFKKLIKNFYQKDIGVGSSLRELPLPIKEEWIQLHTKALLNQRFSVEFGIKESGIELAYEISYHPIYSDEGTISGVSVFGRDITLRKNAENDIIRTNFELDSFVYRASHDLRAPLRSVLGLINLVKSEMDEKERATYLGLVEKSVNKLDTFIADLTNFSRNSRLEVSVSKIDFNSIIEDCLENLKYMDNAEKIKAVINFHPESDFYSDKTRISIIFQNIISNSIKYLNPRMNDSFVRIDISCNSEYARIEIADNGKGIREEYLDKIFNMFFRASQESYGSGLGLYITKQVVEKLKGNISVRSELGVGTHFTITLPNLNK